MKTKMIIYGACYLLLMACGDEFESVDPGLESLESDDFYIGDASTFAPRMHPINRTILMSNYATEATKNGRVLQNASTGQLDYYWQHIASVDAPVIQGNQLSATHFDFNNDKAYVSYHKQGNIHLGAIDIINLTDPHYPEITDQLVFGIADVNALTADTDGTVYIAASHQKRGAAVYRIGTSGMNFNSEVKRYSLSNSLENAISASANGVALTSNSVIVSSGKTHGGTFVVDKNSMRPQDVMSYANGKYVITTEIAQAEYHVSLATGAQSLLRVKQVGSENELMEYGLPEIIHQNVEATLRGKSTMEISPIDPKVVFVALGQEGLRSYDILSGQELSSSKGTMLVTGNTNGITADEDFLYIANGADGLSIASYPELGTIDPLCYWDLPEQPASVNFTKADGEFIFVAKGEGGFHILKKAPKAPYATVTTYNQLGVPENIVQKEVCQDLLPTIFSEALPERQNTMQLHPEYFEMGTKNIEIKESGEIYITFLHEGAGYKNILGYYAYPTNDPPSSLDDLEKIVIFPNASAFRSGGGLIPGNSVELLGTFEAGISIGFFLIANGWKNRITDGYYTQYTDIGFNQSGRQQSLIFHENSCDAVVICFEDINVPNGDNDFNDAIFQIHAEPASAMNTEDYIQL